MVQKCQLIFLYCREARPLSSQCLQNLAAHLMNRFNARMRVYGMKFTLKGLFCFCVSVVVSEMAAIHQYIQRKKRLDIISYTAFIFIKAQNKEIPQS